MGKYTTAVHDHLVLPALAQLPQTQQQLLKAAGRPIPASGPLRLIIDTGSKRSTLVPSIISHLNPTTSANARVETSLATGETSLFWVRLEFPGTSLTAIPALAVAQLALPASLGSFHGVIGRDLLSRWNCVLYEGLAHRLTIRDSPAGWFSWF